MNRILYVTPDADIILLTTEAIMDDVVVTSDNWVEPDPVVQPGSYTGEDTDWPTIGQ